MHQSPTPVPGRLGKYSVCVTIISIFSSPLRQFFHFAIFSIFLYWFLSPHVVYKYMLMSHILLNTPNSIYLSSLYTDHFLFLYNKNAQKYWHSLFLFCLHYIHFPAFPIMLLLLTSNLINFQVQRSFLSSFIWLTTAFSLPLALAHCSFWFFFHIFNHFFSVMFADFSHPYKIDYRVLLFISP